MKRLLACALLALSSIAFSATLNPIQLLNPAGSTVGQAIVSTGPSTAPAWGGVSLNGATGVLPVANGGTGFATFNTGDVLVGGTGGSLTKVNTNSSGLPLISSGTGFPPVFTPLTLAGGGTSATTAAQARTNLGAAATSGTLAQFAATTSAQLAGIVSDETGSGVLVFGTTPTLTNPNIVGTTTNNNANAGSVGEYVTATGSSTAMTTGTNTNLTSISLTAGDWDVETSVQLAPAASTVLSSWIAGPSATSATFGTLGSFVSLAFTTTGSGQIFASPVVRLSLASTTTVFCVAVANFTAGTLNGTGFIRARRVR